MRGDAERWLDRDPLGDPVAEADEMHQNAGEEGIPHEDPENPPRRRANSRRGHGTFANDRPPVAGMVGRDSGEVRLEVLDSSGSEEPGEFVAGSCIAGTIVNADEWFGSSRVDGRHGRVHMTVDHSGPRHRWAIDADGDGVREVHRSTMEGTWTGLRSFPRPFEISWPSFADGQEGPISGFYHVRGLPTVAVIDAKGCLRSKNAIVGDDLDRLVAEAAKAGSAAP